jgi:hypothetical protein
VLKLVSLTIITEHLHDDIVAVNVGLEDRLAEIPIGRVECLLVGLSSIRNLILQGSHHDQRALTDLDTLLRRSIHSVLLAIDGQNKGRLIG